jgi:nucleoside-diphosphate-sugar epimerase
MTTSETAKPILVTGGGGFLGGRIVRMLRDAGHAVRSYSRANYPQLADLGVECHRGDLTDVGNLRRACEGCEAVVHAAARAGIAGAYRDYHEPNVTGTGNVIDACRAAGVKRLVYTSSPSVVFDGRDMEGVDESVPYPDRYAAHYPQTKAIAERMVLAANGPDLATVALRPHLIWGPGDRHLVSRIISRARSLRRIGGTNKRVDSTYIDNAAEAHVLALAALSPGAPAAGHAYFISNGEPRPVWDLVGAILAAADLPPVTRGVSLPVARAAAAVLEAVHRLLRRPGEPRLTRFLLEELTTAHWFDLGAARRDLGYAPRVSIDEGLVRLRKWLREGDGPAETAYNSRHDAGRL